MAQKTRTIDHDEVREWIESRGGRPAVVEGTFDALGGGVLKVDFGDPQEALEELSWNDFFRVFDDNDLAFVYESEQDGVESYTCAFISRTDMEDEESDAAGQDVIDGF